MPSRYVCRRLEAAAEEAEERAARLEQEVVKLEIEVLSRMHLCALSIVLVSENGL